MQDTKHVYVTGMYKAKPYHCIPRHISGMPKMAIEKKKS